MNAGKSSLSDQKRYKHKLNMLGPGQIMFKISLILAACGYLLGVFGVCELEQLFYALATVVFIFLLILVRIELHQDHVLYQLAKSQDPDIQ